MAQNEEIKIKIAADVESAGAAKSLGELKGALESANESTKSLRAQLKEITLELQNTEVGSARFNELSIKAGELKDQIADTQAVINATAGSATENLGKSLQGVASIGIRGFQGLQSAQALFGSDSKALEKSLVQLQAVAGMADAIQSLGGLSDQITNIKAGFTAFTKSAIGGLQGIKGAVAATGIGLLVIAVGLLVAYWDDIKGLMTGVSAEQEKLNELAAAEVETQKSKLDQLNGQDNILRLQGLSEKQILELKIKQTDEVIAATENQIKQNEITFKAQYEAEKRNREILKGILTFLQAPLLTVLKTIDEIAAFAGFETNLAEGLLDFESKLIFDEGEVEAEFKKAQKEQIDGLNKLKNDRAGMVLQIQQIDKQAAEERKKIAQEALDNEKANDAERLQAKRDLQDAELELMDEGIEKELLKNKYKYERLIEDTKNDEKLKNSEKLKLNEAYAQQQTQQEEAIRADFLIKEKELADKKRIAAAEQAVIEATDTQTKYDAELALLKTKYEVEIADTKLTAEEKGRIDAEYIANKQVLDDNYNKWKTQQDAIIAETELSKAQFDLENSQLDFDSKVAKLNQITELQLQSIEAQRLAELSNTELTGAEKEAIEEKYRQQRITAETAATDAIKALKQQELQATLDTAAKGLNAGQALADAVFAVKKRGLEKGSKEEEKVARQQFAVNKALQLGLAVIDGFKAVTSSLAQSPIAIGPVPNPAGIASLAFAIATSAANIVKIAAAKFEGGGGASTPAAPSPSMGGGGGEGGTAPTTFTPSTFFGLGQTQQQGGATTPPPQQVYVLETDITSTQNRVSVIENRAKIE